MAYATITDVFTRYKPIRTMVGTDANDVASVDVASVFISDAEDFINSYLGVRYTTPVPTTPLITQIASDLAIFNMVVEKLNNTPDFMLNRYERAIGMLEKLRDGEMILASTSATLISTGDNFAWSRTGSYHSIFSPVLDPLDQSVDQDWIDAENDARVGDTGVGS